MVRSRLEEYAARIRAELHGAFDEEHTPREVATSFAVGTFITMLPTLGVGLVLFFAIAYLFDSVSKIALFASVLVFNPLVKWGVYASSFALGVFLLGPVEGVTMTDVSMNAGTDVAARLLVGNLVLAIVATAVGYVVVHRLAVRYDASELGVQLEEAIDDLVDERLEG